MAEFTVRLAEAQIGGAFNAAGPDYEMSIEAMLHGIRAVTGVAAKLHWAPAEFLSEQQVSPWSDMPVWLPAQGDYAGFSRRSNAKATAAGLTYRPLADTVTATLEWFSAQPAERQAQLRAGLTAERETALLGQLKVPE